MISPLVHKVLEASNEKKQRKMKKLFGKANNVAIFAPALQMSSD